MNTYPLQVLKADRSSAKPVYSEFTNGYPINYKCSCGKIFRTWKAFLHHEVAKHNRKQPLYSICLVDGGYLRERMKDCKEKEFYFSHKERLVKAICDNDEVITKKCMLRCCPKCEEDRRARYKNKFKQSLLGFRYVKVITLTNKGHYPLSKEKMSEFRNNVRNLMRRLRYKTKYRIQYVRVLEIVAKPDGWYYHFHILVDMPYLQQKTLSNLWFDVSGSSVVWIEMLKDKNGFPIGQIWNRLPEKKKMNSASNYVSKYLAKPLPSMNLDHYAVYVYGKHFVESHLTSIVRQNCTKFYGRICPKCGFHIQFCGEFVKGSNDSEKSLPDVGDFT